jgi:outer membrane receptor protein involved in Fe transport
VAIEGQYLGERRTLAGRTVGAAGTMNATLTQPVGRSWELFATVRNLFDVAYSDPASSQHVQDVIPQNGRTARIGLRWKVGAK